LIGQVPGEVGGVQYQQTGGALARCSFKPVWAIQAGAGPGATVAALSPLSAPIAVKLGVSGRYRATPSPLEVWAGAIYNAHIRHPRFCRLHSDMSEETVRLIWNEYVARAKQLKRVLKRRR
jgi:hypothetical protein